MATIRKLINKMLIFYAMPVSGYCTKVRIVLRLKDIEFEERLPIGGSYGNDEWKTFMPPGSIPAIQHDDFKLFDSEAIVEYLDGLKADPALQSSDLRIRSRHKAIAQFHNTRLEPVVRQLFPVVKSYTSKGSQNAVSELRSSFEKQLQSLCQVTSFDPFIGGEEIQLVDCGFPATIFMGMDILAALNSKPDIPKAIESWLKMLMNHPVIAEEVSNNRAAVGHWLKGFLQ